MAIFRLSKIRIAYVECLSIVNLGRESKWGREEEKKKKKKKKKREIKNNNDENRK